VSRLNRRRDVGDPQVVAGPVVDANWSSDHVWNRATRSSLTSSEGSEASGPRGFRPIPGGVLAHLQERRSTLLRVALTIAIPVVLWAAFDPFGALLFAVILVAVVWLWDR
jgi:hypothetical protein